MRSKTSRDPLGPDDLIIDVDLNGTPVICPMCFFEDKVRLVRGVRLAACSCKACGHRGLKRNTEFDKERRAFKVVNKARGRTKWFNKTRNR